MNHLLEERNRWREEFKTGEGYDPHYLQLYRLHRESDLWRMSRQVEKLCEYVIYLESLVNPT